MAEITNAGATGADHPRLHRDTPPAADEEPVPGTGRARRGRVDLSVIAAWEQLMAAGLAPANALERFRTDQLNSGTDTSTTTPNPAAGLARTALAGGGDRHGAMLSNATLARLACDAFWRRIIVDAQGVPLDVGRAARFATQAQRAALVVRDGGCVIPGCGMPVGWCDIHHHTPWEHDGPTDLDNLYPLCGRHHTEVHAGMWQIEWLDGLPWVRPPRSLYPRQPLLRNTTHTARAEAHRLGRQLSLELDNARTDWLTDLPVTRAPRARDPRARDDRDDDRPPDRSTGCTTGRRRGFVAAPRPTRAGRPTARQRR
jgi:hypothetical protein